MTDAEHDDYVAFSGAKVPTTTHLALSEIERIEAIYRVLLREMRQYGVRANPRWVAISKTHIEQGAMALRRALYRPNEGS